MGLVGSLRMTHIKKIVWIVIIPDLRGLRKIRRIMKNCTKLVHISGKKIREIKWGHRLDLVWRHSFWRIFSGFFFFKFFNVKLVKQDIHDNNFRAKIHVHSFKEIICGKNREIELVTSEIDYDVIRFDEFFWFFFFNCFLNVKLAKQDFMITIFALKLIYIPSKKLFVGKIVKLNWSQMTDTMTSFDFTNFSSISKSIRNWNQIWKFNFCIKKVFKIVTIFALKTILCQN